MLKDTEALEQGEPNPWETETRITAGLCFTLALKGIWSLALHNDMHASFYSEWLWIFQQDFLSFFLKAASFSSPLLSTLILLYRGKGHCISSTEKYHWYFTSYESVIQTLINRAVSSFQRPAWNDRLIIIEWIISSDFKLMWWLGHLCPHDGLWI